MSRAFIAFRSHVLWKEPVSRVLYPKHTPLTQGWTSQCTWLIQAPCCRGKKSHLLNVPFCTGVCLPVSLPSCSLNFLFALLTFNPFLPLATFCFILLDILSYSLWVLYQAGFCSRVKAPPKHQDLREPIRTSFVLLSFKMSGIFSCTRFSYV